MRYVSIFLLLIFIASCQITETITINPDGSGDLEVVQLRDERSYMQLAGEEYLKENIFKDTTFVFKEYIEKYNETFVKYNPEEQQLFQKYAGVKVRIKNSSFEKEFQTVLSMHFNQVSEIPDVYKTENYADDIKYNYALTAEQHYYKIDYAFDGNVFKRVVSITNAKELQNAKDQYEKMKPVYGNLNLTNIYVLKYSFPRKIKSVSNDKASLSPDKKSLTLELQLAECLRDPESTNLEVVLE